MRTYTVHVPSGASAEGAIEGARAVKEGFSWPACFFSFLWALWHGLWLAALVVFALELAFGWLAGLMGFNIVANAAVSLGFALILGWLGNDLRRARLERQGFRERAALFAANGEEAVRAYFLAGAPRDGFRPDDRPAGASAQP